MGIFDKMFGRGADKATKQPGSEQKFNQFKQKYNQRSIELQPKGAAFWRNPVDFILPRLKSDGASEEVNNEKHESYLAHIGY
jgi:hypothetical protein